MGNAGSTTVVRGETMKILKQPVFFHNERGFHIRFYRECEMSDYEFLIQAFGRDFLWRIYKGNPTPVEILEMESGFQDDVYMEYPYDDAEDH